MSWKRIDRSHLNALTWNDWQTVIKDVQTRLTDRVIDDAVMRLPSEHRQLSGPKLASGLRARRNNLELYARRYYDVIDLRRLRLQREAASSERSATKGTWLPRVQLGGRFIEYASEATAPQGEWQTGLQLSYPLYTGGARSASVDRAAAEVRAADAELALGERRIAENIDRAMTTLQAARSRVVALEDAVRQSEEVTRIDQLALEAGAGVQTDYLNAEAELFRVRAAVAEAHAAEIMALLELARVQGQLTQEWLAVHLEAVI